MTSIYVHRNGRTEQVRSIDRDWLRPDSGVSLWVDLAAPSIPELLILTDTFAFHPLSVEDATMALHYPKVEAYEGYLYVILHGIAFETARSGFGTRDVDFFLGSNYLVTVHDGSSRSIGDLADHVVRNPKIMSEGPVALFHRIVDAMIDHYRPEIEQLEDRIDALEQDVFAHPSPRLVRAILDRKREVSALRRIITPQRDVVGRLARREFPEIGGDLSFRFRDVYDHLVRIADDAIIFHDRMTALLDAHLSNVGNRLNEVMKVLAVISAIFMPLTLLAGLWGMNVPLPNFPGDAPAQFWWVLGIIAVVVVTMLLLLRRRRWI